MTATTTVYIIKVINKKIISNISFHMLVSSSPIDNLCTALSSANATLLRSQSYAWLFDYFSCKLVHKIHFQSGGWLQAALMYAHKTKLKSCMYIQTV